MVLRNNLGGGQLKQSEITQIDFRLEEAKMRGHSSGGPSVNLTAIKTARASIIDVLMGLSNIC